MAAMLRDMQAYWSTMATVLIVLALALVTEGRLIFERLNQKAPGTNQGAAVVWVVILTLVALATFGAVWATRSSTPAPDLQENLTLAILVLGLGYAVVLPGTLIVATTKKSPDDTASGDSKELGEIRQLLERVVEQNDNAAKSRHPNEARADEHGFLGRFLCRRS